MSSVCFGNEEGGRTSVGIRKIRKERCLMATAMANQCSNISKWDASGRCSMILFVKVCQFIDNDGVEPVCQCGDIKRTLFDGSRY